MNIFKILEIILGVHEEVSGSGKSVLAIDLVDTHNFPESPGKIDLMESNSTHSANLRSNPQICGVIRKFAE
jgi:hypothetical protein